MEAERSPVRVLLIGNDFEDFCIIRDLVSEISSQDFQLEWLNDLDAAYDALTRRFCDLCLLDFGLGETSSLDFLREITYGQCKVPVILLTGIDDYGIGLQAMQAGADDYLSKSELNAALLERSIRYSIDKARLKELLRKSFDERGKEEVRKSEERRRDLFETMVQGVVYQGPDGEVIDANPAAQSILGLSLDQMLDRNSAAPFRKAIREDGEEFTEETLPSTVALRSGKEVRNVVMGVLHRSGDCRWINTSAMPQFHPGENHPCRVLTTLEDITERKWAEEALRESEARLYALLRQLPLGIGVINTQGQLLLTNPQMNRYVPGGFIPSRDPERPDKWEAYDADGRLLTPEQFPGARALQGETVSPGIEFLHRGDNNQESWVLMSSVPFRSAKGELDGAIVVVQDITQRKKAEVDLERMRNILSEGEKIAHMGTFEYIADTHASVWSEEQYRIFGLDPSGPSPAYDVMLEKNIHPDDAALLHQTFTAAIQNSSVYELEHRIVRPDGSVRWVYDRAHPYFDENGKLTRYVGATLDITERKRGEEELRTTVQRFHKIMSNILSGILLVDERNGVEFANQSFCDQFGIAETPLSLNGLKTAEMIERISSAFDHPEESAARIRQTLSKGDRVEGEEIQMSNGRSLLRDFIPIFVDGSPRGRMWQHRDITDRKNSERLLRKSEERYRMLFESSLDAVFLVGPHGEIYSANSAACKMFGWSEKDLKKIGRSGIVDNSNRRLKTALAEGKRTGNFRGELTFVRRDGTRFPGEVSSNTFQEDGRNLTNISIRDITDRKEMEKQLLDAYEALNRKALELQEKSENLEELNTALKVLLKQREGDKQELGEAVLANVKILIEPFMEKLKKGHLSSSQKTIVEILESHLNEIVSPFYKMLGLRSTNLTPTELRVAGFIRDGKSTDEIAEILCVSHHTVSRYRDYIREKLGLRGKKTNLRSYLLSMS
jgi:PAS domain S-box-containing protein